MNIKNFLYVLVSWTWGLPQTLAGAVTYLCLAKRPHFRSRGAVSTAWGLRGAGISLGMFTFVGIPGRTPSGEREHALCAHEYGHTLQSLILGPLYLPVIGLPSLLWAAKKHRSRPYYSFWTERWATVLGEKHYKNGDQARNIQNTET